MTFEATVLDELKTLIAGIASDAKAQVETGIKPLQEEADRQATEVLRISGMLRDVKRANLWADRDYDAEVIQTGKYRGMDTIDMQIIGGLLQSEQEKRGPAGLSDAGMVEWADHYKAAMDSTTPGAGDELVPTQSAARLWMDINLATSIGGLFPRIQMPTQPFDLPLQLGDINWYPGVENVATKATTLVTAENQLDAKEIVGEVAWSYTLDEDSVIAMMTAVRENIVRNAHEVIDDMLLNADTTLTNNINADGATIAPSDEGKAQWLLGWDGLRHLPLVDNTNQGNDHNAAPSDDMFNEVRMLLGKYGVHPNQCTYITDINTWIRSQTVANIRTLDKFGPQATILTGQLGAHEGIPVIVSEQMLKTASDGLVTDGAAGTVGGLLIVNRGMWTQGFRREITIETVRDAQKRQHIVVLSFRIAMLPRGTRSTATHTALQYNITGVS